MSTVDERVVKMEFDNKEFEKNANETMSTLDKLKEALKFDNLKDSFNKITEAANKVDVSNIERSTDAISAKFSAMQVIGYTAIANLTNRLMNFAHGVVAGTFSKIVQGGLNRSFNIEKAKFTIEGLGVSFKKLDDDISYAVRGTAYGYDEAARAASSMAASGIKAGKQMKTALRSISGMAAMTGSSYSEIADVFTTVAGNSKLFAQQLNQLSARGINAAATLRDFINANEDVKKSLREDALKSTNKKLKEFAKNAKWTEKNIRDLTSAGLIDFDLFSRAIDDAFGEHAKSANKTFNGVMTNIKATLSRIGQMFEQPLIANNKIDTLLEYVRTPIRHVANTVKDLRKYTKEQRADLYASLKQSGIFSTKLIDNLKKTKEFSKKTTEEIRDIYAKDPKQFLESVKKIKGYSDTTEKQLKKLMRVSDKRLKHLYKQNPEEFLAQVQSIQKYSKLTSDELGTLMRSTKEEFIKTLKSTEKYSKKSNKELGEIYDKYYKVQYNLVGVFQGVKRVFDGIENAIKNSKFLKTFLKTTEKGCKALILLLNGVAGRIDGISKNGKKYLEVIGDRKHLIPVGRLWRKFYDMLGLQDKDLKRFKNTFKGLFTLFDTFKFIIGEIVNVFKPTKKETKSFISLLLEFTSAISNVIQDFAKWVKESGAVRKALTFIKDIFGTILRPVTKFVKAIINLIAWFRKGQKPVIKFVDAFGKLFEAVQNLFKVALDDIVSLLEDVFGIIISDSKDVDESSGIIYGAITLICNVLGFLADHLADVINWIADFFKEFNIFRTIGGIAAGFASIITGKVIPAFKGLWNWIKKFAGGAFKSFEKLFNFKPIDTSKLTKNVSNIKDPFSELFKDFTPKTFVEKIGQGIQDGLDYIVNFDYNSFFDKVIKGFNKFVDYLKEARKKISDAYDKIKSTMESKGINFESMGDKLQKGFDNAFNVIVDNTPKAVKVVGKVLTKAFKTIKDALPDPKTIAESLSSFIVSAIEKIVDFIPWFIETAAYTVQIIANDLGKILGSLSDQIVEIINTVFTQKLTIGSGDKKRIVNSLSTSMTDSIGDVVKNINWDAILKAIESFASIRLAWNAGNLFKSGKNLLDTLSKGINNLLGLAGKNLDDEKKIQKLAQIAEIIKSLALAIGVLAAALLIFSFVPVDKLKQGFLYLSGIMALFGILLIVITGLYEITERSAASKDVDNKIDKVVSAIAEMAKGLAQLIGALVLLSFIPIKEGRLEESLAIIAVLLLEIWAFVAAITKVQPSSVSLDSTALAIEAIGKGIFKLVEAIAILSLIKPEKSWNAVLQIAALLFSLAGAIKILDGATKGFDLKSLLSVVPIIALLVTIVGAMWVIKEYELGADELGWVVGAVGILVVLTIALNKLAGANPMAALDAVTMTLPIIILLIALIAALWAIKELEMNPQDLLWISVSLLIIAGVIAVLGMIGTADPAAGIAAAAMVAEFLFGLLAMLLVLGAIADSDKVKELVTKGGEVLRLIGQMLAQVVVGFIDGVKTAIQNLMGVQVDDAQVEKIDKVADLLAKLAKVQTTLSKGGGKLLTFFAGDQPFTKFGNGIANLFKSFATVGTEAGKVTNIDKIESLTTVAEKLSAMVKVLKDTAGLGDILNIAGQSKLSKLGSDLLAFADSAVKAIGKFDGADTSSMKDAAKDIASSVKSISKALPSEGLKATGTNAVDDIKSGVKGGGQKIAKQLSSELSSAVSSISTDKFSSKGEFFIKAFIKGMENKRKDIKEKGKSLAKAAASEMDASDAISSATTAGENVVKGFKNGLDKNYLKAQIASICKSIGKSAVENLKKGATERSPSREATTAGENVDIGFINGMVKRMKTVYSTAQAVGRSSMDGLKTALTSADELLNAGVQDPVIRPVLDLSNVKMGARSINSMFGRNEYALGVAGSLIESGVRGRDIVQNINLTVNGSEDPKQWADEFAAELEIQART